MNNNHIKQFFHEYKYCPQCDSLLKIGAYSKITSEMRFIVSITPHELTIKVNSNYYINPRKNEFEFSISIRGGHILHGNLANQFVSLYDLSIIIFKECLICRSQNEGFYRSINLFYNRTDSAFTAIPYTEWFCFYYDEQYYFFLNDYLNRSSILRSGAFPIGALRNEPIEQNVPYMPFEKFNFQSRAALFGKINAIQLLT
jgi:hypothetical protein